MSAVFMDGKALSAKVRGQILEQTHALEAKGVRPGLAVILVGEDPASQVYVRNKEKACVECGFYSEKYVLPAETSEEALLGLVAELNQNPRVHGILCQLPLPKQIREEAVIAAIDPEKDVDAFHSANVGRIMIGDFDFLPCTPAGVMALLDEYGIDPDGKHCVVIGRSNIVGKPMSMLLLHRNGTVTVCHSHTRNLAGICHEADILVAAVGRAHFVTADMVKPGATVIDVGMNRVDGKLCGDVAPDVAEVAGYLTPVPGGVGPMTITMLMKNTLRATHLQMQKHG